MVDFNAVVVVAPGAVIGPQAGAEIAGKETAGYARNH
jgi:hypothetical protein